MHRFVSTWVGYVAALVITVIVMILYNHAQPALLYLVPANIGCRLMAGRGQCTCFVCCILLPR